MSEGCLFNIFEGKMVTKEKENTTRDWAGLRDREEEGEWGIRQLLHSCDDAVLIADLK